ncbi:hypothetical protein [Natribacillus halophilus]|uniref:Uncharacterized protein n=1 Tax=Natribacillus halophilus TaxID=549003 RepID=A0A1G8KZK5_9BACI|nr:hypothetical protein [Natribacillus halophilus]SDI48842.1 hypothetical protein SAMN04488123_102400 [Natribacillus halophilus]
MIHKTHVTWTKKETKEESEATKHALKNDYLLNQSIQAVKDDLVKKGVISKSSQDVRVSFEVDGEIYSEKEEDELTFNLKLNSR